jgi:uncharacterized delta-60 repeat protein
VASLLVSLAVPLGAADGDLDPTFRDGGKFLYATPSNGGEALAFRGDGVPLVGYTADLGSGDHDMRVLPVPDQGFTTYCAAYGPDLGGTNEDRLGDIAVIGDRIYVAGSAAPAAGDTWQRSALAAFSASSCLPDPLFGGAAGMIGETNGDLAHVALGVRSDGAIRTLQAFRSEGGVEAAWVVGIGSTGGFDPSYGSSLFGFFPTFDAEWFEPRDAALQPDGRLVVVGTVQLTNGDRDLGVARLAGGGGLDSSFSGDGLASFSFDIVDAGFDEAEAVALLPDGRIAIAGRVERPGGATGAAVALLTPAGQFDNDFGVFGRYVFGFLGGDRLDSLAAVAVQEDGKLVVGGRTGAKAFLPNYDWGIARLLPEGDDPLDPDFADGGKRIVAFDEGSTGADSIADLAIDPDGRIVATGSVATDLGWAIGVARLLADSIFSDGFESAGLSRWDGTAGAQ